MRIIRSVVGFMPAISNKRSLYMAWTKPEFTVVAVTLEVTAYAGKR
jgi:coenzyme PQQ precursor peptide PqqA